jgi:hypothetical protein
VLVGDGVGLGVSPSKTLYSQSLKYLEELRLVLSNCCVVESASLGGVWVGMGH